MPAPAGMPATAPTPTAPTMTAPPPASGGAGTVLETMDAGGYTYAKLDRGGAQVWIAGPVTKLAVGAKVTTTGEMLMTGFHSDTLNRTFDQIYFAGGINVEGGVADATLPAAASAGVKSTTPAGMPAQTGPATAGEKITPAAGGQTVAQLFAGKATLVGKPVVIRGKVIKFNAGILGRNWIHVQDGTGAAGSNDLLITTPPEAAAVVVGSVIVARGKLAADKDFGAGYAYPILVEDATIADK
jgi:hypothetical protein